MERDPHGAQWRALRADADTAWAALDALLSALGNAPVDAHPALRLAAYETLVQGLIVRLLRVQQGRTRLRAFQDIHEIPAGEHAGTYSLADLNYEHVAYAETVWPALPTLDGFLDWLGHRAPESSSEPALDSTQGQARAEADADDELLPTLLDACSCPDCATDIVWTIRDDVRTAWSVHQCPRSGGKPL